MPAAFYALIIPQEAPPSQPPRPWGPINYPDQGLPGPQPIPGWGPGFPTPPIYMPPARPPGMWGPIYYPDQGLPGNQPYPDQGLPGWQPYPGQGLPQPPLHTWGGRPPLYVDIGGPGPQPIPGWGPGFPTNPIVIPPGDLPVGPVADDKMVIVVYVPGIGYKMAVVPKPPAAPGYNPPTGPSTELPTPVKK